MNKEKEKTAPELTDAESKIDDDINCLISKAQKGDIESLKTIKKIVDEKSDCKINS